MAERDITPEVAISKHSVAVPWVICPTAATRR
nr:Uncharacterised protein [Escherichia coli]